MAVHARKHAAAKPTPKPSMSSAELKALLAGASTPTEAAAFLHKAVSQGVVYDDGSPAHSGFAATPVAFTDRTVTLGACIRAAASRFGTQAGDESDSKFAVRTGVAKFSAAHRGLLWFPDGSQGRAVAAKDEL